MKHLPNMAGTTTTTIRIGGKEVSVSNLDKVFYPETGFTKGEVINYYVRIAPVLLPHLKNRPLTLKRYPDGVDSFFFYEKQCPSHRPKWISTARVPKEDGQVDYCLMNNLAALVWAVNLADLELHTFLHQAPRLQRPTAVAFDLDPGAPADLVACCRVGLWLKELLAGMGLKCFAKTSGSKGLQIYVPLNTPVTYEQTKAFARGMAERLQQEHPREVVAKMSKALRKGKIFIDWSQNDDHKTTVSVYSLRAKPQPTVSTPVTWTEIQATLKKKDPQRLVFQSDDVLARVKKLGDLFTPVLSLRQKLPK
jgi:bifunctional non-homologous end joining protein LigD